MGPEGPTRLLEGDYIIQKASGSYTYSRPNVFNIKYEKK
jgi:diaminopimelate decarboxylase